ncbi:S-adenosyl-L-methionine-dependent methyltransferase [Hypoxylon sp. FL1284]|nr:S-adenosyl-L-methionine-dependent methyltransferase [Hypoxylon sp. FL1284]
MASAPLSNLSEMTLESLKLPNFNPPGLEVDDGSDEKSDFENPFVSNPIKKDQNISDADRPLHPGEKYYIPIDNAEFSRLDKQHVVLTRLLDGDLFKAPIKDPKRVLDVGTGTGIWAAEVAKKHPDAEVLGIDLGKPTPPEVPPNCKWEEKDFTGPWNFTTKFDLVHCRLLFSAIHDPRQLLQRIYDSLAPGGYLEYHDSYGMLLDFDGTASGTDVEQLFFNSVLGVTALGNTTIISMPLYKQWMTEIGFEDVVEIHRALPLNGWAEGPYKAIGEMWMKNAEALVGGPFTHFFTKGLGWSPEKAADAIQKALVQLPDTSIHSYFPFFVVYGRKPLSAT